MRTLILLRHGEAAPVGLGGDMERPLTAKGEQDAHAAGLALARLGLKPEVALVSPARRAQQTWAAAALTLEGCPARSERGLLHVGAQAVLAVAGAAGADAVLVVGHNPGLADLADRLARRAGPCAATAALKANGFAPASAAVFTCAGDAWRFEAFLPPENSA